MCYQSMCATWSGQVLLGSSVVDKYCALICMQRETENQNNFSNVYALLDLDEPSAKSIRGLDTIMGELQGHCAEHRDTTSIGPPLRWAGVRLQPSALHQDAGALGFSSRATLLQAGTCSMDALALRRVLALCNVRFYRRGV